jgi:O-antigen/teichoic acid export membrane protein
MSTARKAGHAAGALFLRKCWTSIINLGVIAYLASTLSWEAFGVVPVCATILAVIQILAVSGISEYVIFFKGSGEERIKVTNAAVWLNFAASLGVVVVCIALAPAVADYYDNDVIGPVILIMLCGFFSSMVASIPKALYRKDINYGPLVALETVQQTAVSIGQVLLAWQGFGVFSLVLPHALVNPIITAVFLWKSPHSQWGGFGV